MLSKQHLEYQEKIRAFCLEKIEPLAKTLDDEQRFPEEHMQPLTDMGLLSCLIPEEYGGQPVDTLSYIIAVEEASRVCGSTGIMLAAHNSLGTYPVLAFGTEEQKQKYLPRAAKGELMAFGLSEPDAGSDAGGTRTQAKKVDDGWVINGSKCWITSATKAFATIATARTSEDPSDKRITSFILEKDWDGYDVGKKENKLGLRGSDTAFLHFDDLKVPDDARLGEVGQGFKQMLMTLDGGRISIGAMALGLGQGSLDCALKYAAEREQFGKPIAYFQGIQHRLADMATELQAARLMIYEAAEMKDAGVPFSRQSAMCKLYASEVATRAATTAMTVMGAVSYYDKYPAERIWRDVKLCEIGEGTSEIQRLVIARDLLKSLEKA
ncbi:acyl-CoA dehydrogenase [candidate division GN15 bacterium]|nr:acyl-CoA dehydrogenase [candidate division GN15 bacterium]